MQTLCSSLYLCIKFPLLQYYAALSNTRVFSIYSHSFLLSNFAPAARKDTINLLAGALLTILFLSPPIESSFMSTPSWKYRFTKPKKERKLYLHSSLTLMSAPPLDSWGMQIPSSMLKIPKQNAPLQLLPFLTLHYN